ncbi:MAG TPA: sigma-70 family RNA polymerase sigma factor [Polyangiaceae bacterium]|nr:sigma-70 family RNA polymerase sigma factor [Polyangiaceae bacterium]
MTASLTQSLLFSAPRSAQAPDLALVLAARDAAALAKVYAEHRAALCAFCSRVLGDRAAAEDLTHDVFLRLPELIHKLEPGRSLRAFLLAIAANRAQHYRRAAARRRKLAERFVQEPVGTALQPDDAAEQRWVQSQIARALEHLPPEQQTAFELAELEGQDAASIARRLSIPEATARTRLFHARRKLRLLLSAWGLALVFVVSAAFAASQPAVRHAVVMRVQAWFGSAQSPQSRAIPGRVRSLSPTPPRRPAQPERESESAPLTLEALPLLPPAAPPPAVGHQSSAISLDEEQPTSAPGLASQAPPPAAEDPALERYRDAHRTHFGAGDPAAALVAWDRYLVDFPASSFAADARFNRALCLLRLGQSADARRALEAFAGAPPGSYRQRDAAALLEGMEAAAASLTAAQSE